MNTLNSLIDDAEFKALLNLFMSADPFPASEEDHEKLLVLLNRESQRRGYDGWIEAFHDWGKPKSVLLERILAMEAELDAAQDQGRDALIALGAEVHRKLAGLRAEVKADGDPVLVERLTALANRILIEVFGFKPDEAAGIREVRLKGSQS